jgi:hypothetical protein
VLTPEEQADHDRSVFDYPHLNLSPNEYVVIDVERHPIGIVLIWLVSITAFAIMVLGMIFVSQDNFVTDKILRLNLAITSLVMAILSLIGGAVVGYVYRQDYFIVTNQRVFSRTQYTPFAHRSQNVEMEHVEDVSYIQTNILQTILNYGTIRLSTVGDEHTYVFTFVDHPAEQLQVIDRVVQAVDEGEPTKFVE